MAIGKIKMADQMDPEYSRDLVSCAVTSGASLGPPHYAKGCAIFRLQKIRNRFWYMRRCRFSHVIRDIITAFQTRSCHRHLVCSMCFNEPYWLHRSKGIKTKELFRGRKICRHAEKETPKCVRTQNAINLILQISCVLCDSCSSCFLSSRYLSLCVSSSVQLSLLLLAA